MHDALLGPKLALRYSPLMHLWGITAGPLIGGEPLPQAREIGLAIGGARRGEIRFAIGGARDAGRATLQPLRLERRHQGSQDDHGGEDLHRPKSSRSHLLYTQGSRDDSGGPAAPVNVGSSRRSKLPRKYQNIAPLTSPPPAYSSSLPLSSGIKKRA